LRARASSDLEHAEQLRSQAVRQEHKLQGAAKRESPPSIVDWSQLRLGSVVPSVVSEHAPYGIVVDLEANEVVCWGGGVAHVRAYMHGLHGHSERGACGCRPGV